MKNEMMSRASVIGALALALVALPAAAEAQGRGNAERESNRPELIRRGEDRSDRDRRGEARRAGDRRESDRRDERRGPPFCRNGEGHPVHGMQWCRDKGFGSDYGGILGRLPRGDDRRSGSYYEGSSYERSHQEFHARHDRQCRMRAAERPLDLQWQIRVRSECKERHDEWHERAGRRHG